MNYVRTIRVIALSVFALAIFVFGGLYFMGSTKVTIPETSNDSENLYTQVLKNKKVFYIDSYHEGYEWSDGVTRGVTRVFDGTGVELQIFRMDTKRNTDPLYIEETARAAKDAIEAFQPNVLIVSDDNAFKHIVMPYYKDADLPVVFSGLNWDASVYDAPYTNTTGMVEISPTKEMLDEVYAFTEGRRLGFLSSDTLSEHKTLENYKRILGLNFEQESFVLTTEDWKQAFVELQNEVDVLILENNAGIPEWSDSEMATFVEENIKIPTVSSNEWLRNETVLAFTKVPEEQGEWAAIAAIEILKGKKPSEIPVAYNKEVSLILNLILAEKLNIAFKPETIKAANTIVE